MDPMVEKLINGNTHWKIWKNNNLQQIQITAMMIHWRQSNGSASGDTPLEANGTGAWHLVIHDELMEVVRLKSPRRWAKVLLRPWPANAQGQCALLSSLQVHLLWDGALLIPVMYIAHDVLIHILTHQLAELLVGVIVVGRVVRLIPRRVAKGMALAIDLRVHTLQHRWAHHGSPMQRMQAGVRIATQLFNLTRNQWIAWIRLKVVCQSPGVTARYCIPENSWIHTQIPCEQLYRLCNV